MRCPRCRLETPEEATFCPACGAPLALAPEPPVRPLAVNVSLDRRGPRRADAPAEAHAAPASPARPAPVEARPTPVSSARPEPVEGRAAPRTLTPPRPVAPAPAPPPPAARPAAAAPLATPAPRPAATRPPPRAPAPVAAHAPADLPDIPVDVAPVEVHLRRGSDLRRIAAWAIDVTPFAAVFLWGTKAALDRVPRSRAEDPLSYLDAAAAHGSALVVPILVGVLVLYFVYATLSHALAGATLGKWAAGLRVVGPDGARPGLLRSAVRTVLAVAGAGALGLGVLLALFTRSGRALHDLLARTWVVEAGGRPGVVASQPDASGPEKDAQP